MVLCCAVLSPICLFATLCSVAHQAPLSMELTRQEYWSGLPFPMPEDLPNLGIEPVSFMPPALAPEPQYEINTHILLKRILKIIMTCLRSPKQISCKA